MKCLRELSGDYAYIDTMLDVLNASVNRLSQRRSIDSHMWHRMLRFFREFLHGCHRAKVDVLILPCIAHEGTVAEIETLARVRARNDIGAAIFEKLAGLGTPQSDSPSMVNIVSRTARLYVDDSRQRLLIERSLLEGFLVRTSTVERDQRLFIE